MRKIIASKISKTDRSFLFLILGFLLFGIVIIANSTIIHSDSVYDSPYRFVFLQIGWVLLGLLGFFFFYTKDYKRIDTVAMALLVFDLVSLLVLAVASAFPCDSSPTFAPCINGANRWLYINASPLPKLPVLGVVGFQPGEMAKLVLIMYLGIVLPRKIQSKQTGFWIYLLSTGLLSTLVIAQPNMSTSVMIAMIGTASYFSSGDRLKNLLITIPVFLALAVLLILISPYRRQRWLTQFEGLDQGEREEGYHSRQIQIALGSGGLFGVGFGQSRQKYYYLPEVASDSIFAIIGEEFGFLGTVLVTCAFGYLIYRGFRIAKNAKTLRGSIMASGITSWVGLQFLVNVGAMTQLLPLTGIPIPLISYGGSSMVFSLMGLGILANIEKEQLS